jgi:hypothetical protein
MHREGGVNTESEEPYAVDIVEPITAMLSDPTLLENIFAQDKVSACQQIINEARADFFITSRAHMEALRDAVATPEGVIRDASLKPIALEAWAIQQQANALGFSFLAQLCAHVCDLCESNARLTPRHAMLLYKLVNALIVAFDKNVIDDGGEIARDVIADLERFSKRSLA